MNSDDFSQHDDLDAARLAELREAMASGDLARARNLMGELIFGWRQIVEGYLVSRAGREVADEVIGRVEEKLLRLLIRKQEFSQPWGKVYWQNAKWVLADVQGERQNEAARRADLDDVAAEIRDPTTETEFEALDDRLSVDAARLDRALAKLSDDDRRLLQMLYWDDLDAADAAAGLGIKPGSLAVRKHRAIERLRTAFFDPDVIDPDGKLG